MSKMFVRGLAGAAFAAIVLTGCAPLQTPMGGTSHGSVSVTASPTPRSYSTDELTAILKATQAKLGVTGKILTGAQLAPITATTPQDGSSSPNAAAGVGGSALGAAVAGTSVKYSPPSCESAMDITSQVIPSGPTTGAALAYSSTIVGISTTTDPALLEQVMEKFPSSLEELVKTCGHIDMTVSIPASQYLPPSEGTGSMTIKQLDASTRAHATFAVSMTMQLPPGYGGVVPPPSNIGTILEAVQGNVMVTAIDSTGGDVGSLANTVNSVLDEVAKLASPTS